MKGDAGLTGYDGKTIIIRIPRHIRHRAFLGDGFARNTIAHEFGHAVMHFEKLIEGAVMARRSGKNITPKWIPSYESSEHQAKIFAPAFLINDQIAQTLQSAEEISVHFGVSLESAEIYFKQLVDERDRPANVERVLRKAQEFRARHTPAVASVSYLDEPCPACSEKTLFPVGSKFMCATCDNVTDLFQDGDRFGS